MRRLIPLLVVLASLALRAADEPAVAPPSPAEPAAEAAPSATPDAPPAPVGFIRPGETIELRMSYGILGTAGTTTIETFTEQDPAGPRYRIHVTTRSSGLVDSVYPVANDSESVLDAATGRPLTITTKGRSGKRLTEKTTTFDYAQGRAVHVNAIRPQHNATVALPSAPAYDLMVAVMQARDWRLKPGESRRVQCVNDEDFFTIEVTALAEERIKVPAGTFDTVVLEPRQVGELTGFFKKGGALKVWISKGDRPQIIRLDTKTKIGTIVAVLTRDETKPPAAAAPVPPPPNARPTPVAVPAPADTLADWPADADPRVVGHRVAERFLVSPHAFWAEFGTISYSEVCAWTGALDFASSTEGRQLVEKLAARFEPFFDSEAGLVPKPDHVDNSVFGALPLALYREIGHARLRPYGLAFADQQWAHPTPEGLTDQTRFWIDDMYMITALQVRAFRATGEQRYVDRTAAEMVVYLERLQRPNGLFFHAPDAPHHWGRGNGWMAAGLTLLLSDLPETHPLRPRLLAAYRQMMATLLTLQTPEGMWRQLLDQPDAWPETSCTGMFAYAFATGVKRGWLERATYAPATRRAWLALVTYLEPNGDLREVCVGTGTKDDRQHYLDRPRRTGDFHGQAPLLWTAAALCAP